MNQDYIDFLRTKIKMANQKGFDIDLSEIHPLLWRHQPGIVQWAVQGGCRAIFASFGLGKTLMQAEILRQIQKRVGGNALVVLPLGVRQEFKIDGEKIGMNFEFIQSESKIHEGCNFYLTNYESVRDGKIDPNKFCAVSLDEAAVLRSFGSDTYQTFLPLFSKVKYKFVATAMPAPNRLKELLHYAAFLGIMDSGQGLTRFFQRDSTKANNLTLYPHKEKEFWLWVHSWAIFLSKPSDLGFSDDGYDLPPLNVQLHEVATNHLLAGVEQDGQGRLFKDAALGLKDAAAEKRDSMELRVEKMKEIISESPDDHFIIWHDLEDERHAIKKAIPEAVSLYGSLELDKREDSIIEFSNGGFKYLSAKPIIAGSGCNFQRHCHRAIFLGVGYKFHDFLQAIHRIYRFLQKEEVRIDIIYSEAEREILKDLMGKWEQHKETVNNMKEIMQEHGLNGLSMADVLSRTIGVERIEVKSDLFQVANNDTVIEARRKADNSVDLMVTSIPFANHYEYTPSYNDFGHTESNNQFWEQMDFLTPELLRVLRPGRVYCCHVKDRILFGNATGTGFPTVSPFHVEAILNARKHGFEYMGMITVVTDVVRENNQTYRLGWSEQCKDGSKMGVGSPEYVLLFRKPQTDKSRGYADDPVKKEKAVYTRARWQVDAHAFWRSSGDRQITPEEMAAMGPANLAKAFTDYTMRHLYDYEFHVKIGETLDQRGCLPSSFMSLAPGSNHPDVWHDINRMITLNGNQTSRGVENHICPLQLDIIKRLINRYSNPGDIVYDPFGGLMSVPYMAVKMGRIGQGVELNTQYFFDGVHYCRAAESEINMPSLFDVEPPISSESMVGA
jgi:DNA modification methylase